MSLFWISQEEYARLSRPDAGAAAEAIRLRQLCAYNRINAMGTICAARHGWIGASFSAIEILTAIYFKVARHPRDEAAGDLALLGKGHAAAAQYAALAGLGVLPVEALARYKQKGGPPAHADRSVPCVATNTGSLGQTLSKAFGMAWARRQRKFFVVLGDGELQEGQNFEALSSISHHQMSNVVTIVDRNFIQSDSEVADIKAIPDLPGTLRGLGFEVTLVADGNDIVQVGAALKDAAAAERPTVLVADTRKGAGVSFMAAKNSPRRGYPWHGGIPSATEYLDALAELGQVFADPEAASRLAAYLAAARRELTTAPPSPPPPAAANSAAAISTGAAFAAEMSRLATEHPEMVLLDADLEKPCGLRGFAERFPEQYLEMGIAEQDMVSAAGGLALAGKLPVVNTYASFMRRGFEQMYVNASEETKIIYAGHYAGLCYTTDGKTHQCTGDIAMARSIPGMLVVYPAFPSEIPGVLEWYSRYPRHVPLYLRLHRTPSLAPPPLENPPEFRFGWGTPLRKRRAAVCALTCGPHLAAFAAAAVDRLTERGTTIDLHSVSTLRGLAPEYLRELADTYQTLLVVEENIDAGGLLDEIAAGLARLPLPQAPRIKHLAVDDFTFSTRDPYGLYRHFGLDPESLENWLDAESAAAPDFPAARKPPRPTTTSWIETYGGTRMNPLAARPCEISIDDIAHSLSLQCRFNGHCHRFYSVAEHCVHVAGRLAAAGEPGILALWGLLHDASETYLCDIPRPIKQSLPEYLEWEKQLGDLINQTLAGAAPDAAANARILQADNELLATEAFHLTNNRGRNWNIGCEIDVGIPIQCWTPEQAKNEFLARFAKFSEK